MWMLNAVLVALREYCVCAERPFPNLSCHKHNKNIFFYRFRSTYDTRNSVCLEEINQFQRQFIASLRLFMYAQNLQFDLIETKKLYWETNTRARHRYELILVWSQSQSVARFESEAAATPNIRQSQPMARTQIGIEKPNTFDESSSFFTFFENRYYGEIKKNDSNSPEGSITLYVNNASRLHDINRFTF